MATNGVRSEYVGCGNEPKRQRTVIYHQPNIQLSPWYVCRLKLLVWFLWIFLPIRWMTTESERHLLTLGYQVGQSDKVEDAIRKVTVRSELLSLWTQFILCLCAFGMGYSLVTFRLNIPLSVANGTKSKVKLARIKVGRMFSEVSGLSSSSY